MKDLRVGCSGWSYKGWIGPFYPTRTKASEFLSIYSRVFNTVEIDSTFYAPPAENAVEKWLKSTPDGFVFCPKMPSQITHENRLNNVDIPLEKFLSAIRNLKTKLGTILVQLPPSFSYDAGIDSLKEFIPVLPNDLEFALEFRHDSWFKESTFRLLKDNNITLVWSEIPMAKSPGYVTTSNVYMRLIGNRSIKEAEFGTIQKDKNKEMDYWVGKLNEKKDDIEKAYVYSNNHFQGFAPGTVNGFRSKMNLPLLDWPSESTKIGRDPTQRTLF